MYSNCCGSEPSYLSDELCGSCLEHAVFYDEDEDEIDETSKAFRDMEARIH